MARTRALGATLALAETTFGVPCSAPRTPSPLRMAAHHPEQSARIPLKRAGSCP
ncbi:hypothetical protein [Pendulispora albinea]|uniref:Uncharacterized protein n=1 Tax=Pendulispora albinea TaxID=2741071 RepID=A0ABZ2M5U5_9BACT